MSRTWFVIGWDSVRCHQLLTITKHLLILLLLQNRIRIPYTHLGVSYVPSPSPQDRGACVQLRDLVRLDDVLWEHGDFPCANRRDDGERTVHSRAEETLDGTDACDWIEVGQLQPGGVHDVFGNQFVQLEGRLPLQKRRLLEFNVSVVQTFVEKIPYPLRHLQSCDIVKGHVTSCEVM